MTKANEPNKPNDLDASTQNDLDALGKTYREAEDDMPPPALDDAIRAAARKAVGARPQPIKKLWAVSWNAPFAVAATVVLTVSISLLAINERPELAPPPPVATYSRPDMPNEPIAKATGSAAVEVTRQVPQHSEKRESSPSPASPSLLDKRSADVASRPNAFPPMLPAAPQAEMQPSLRNESASSDAAAREDMPAGAVAGQLAAHVPAMKSLAQTRTKAAAAEPDTESPEHRIERIRQLRAEGKTTEADEALKKFKERYPGYRLPADLAP